MPADSRMKQKQSLKITISKRPKVSRKKKSATKRICLICGSQFFAVQAKSCSVLCRKKLLSAAGRKSASLRPNRSKDEIRLFELCSSTYNNCLSNHIIAEGWDADIVLPDFKLAILWNGPWHYKEMNMSNHSLLQVQTRDNIKTELFKSLGWQVLIFEDRYYTPNSAFDIIKESVARVRIERT